MQRILVTGATGFIGQHVIRELLLRKYAVIASSVQEEKARQLPWFDQVEYIPFDLRQVDPAVNYYDFFGRPDAMIHLAWEGLPNYKAAFHLEDNLPRHYSFLSNIIANGLKDLTVTGTCFEYGMQEGCLTETMECSPDNAYAKAKYLLQQQLESLTGTFAFRCKWVRLFYMYGAGQSANSLIPQLEKALANHDTSFNMSGGEQVRDFLPVEKVAAYIVAVALQIRETGIINCCSGVPVSVKDFVLDYLRQRGKSIQLNLGFYPYADYEPMRFWGDNNKLKKILANDHFFADK